MISATFVSGVSQVLNKPSEYVSMKLLYSIRVPTMMYACEATRLDSRQMQALNEALNDSIWHIFTYN